MTTVTDQTLTPAGDAPAAQPAAEPQRELIFVTFLALALTPFCWTRLLAHQGLTQWLSLGLFSLPYFAGVLWLAHADQNLARANRSHLDQLAVLLLMLIFPLNAAPYWFAARHLARYPAARLMLWVAALVAVALALLYVVDWPALRPVM